MFATMFSAFLAPLAVACAWLSCAAIAARPRLKPEEKQRRRLARALIWVVAVTVLRDDLLRSTARPDPLTGGWWWAPLALSPVALAYAALLGDLFDGSLALLLTRLALLTPRDPARLATLRRAEATLGEERLLPRRERKIRLAIAAAQDLVGEGLFARIRRSLRRAVGLRRGGCLLTGAPLSNRGRRRFTKVPRS